MSERIHVLAQQLFGKASVAECDLEAIRETVRRYPYFAPAQFLLLEKLKQESSPEYTAQLQKAVLFYHSPLEFEYFISSDRFYTEAWTEEAAPAELQAEVATRNEEPVGEAPQDGEPASRIEAPPPPPAPPIEPAQAQSPPLPQAEAEPLAFEPFHTVDYFASQGIRLSQEEASKDKFGKQLKSFTEWLKTMKRLPQQAPTQSIDGVLEKNVQHLAADSVHEADVVTEAMAEVWLKQGNRSKAAEVYRKLSLLHPSKNAYFAAKIDQLKS